MTTTEGTASSIEPKVLHVLSEAAPFEEFSRTEDISQDASSEGSDGAGLRARSYRSRSETHCGRPSVGCHPGSVRASSFGTTKS